MFRLQMWCFFSSFKNVTPVFTERNFPSLHHEDMHTLMEMSAEQKNPMCQSNVNPVGFYLQTAGHKELAIAASWWQSLTVQTRENASDRQTETLCGHICHERQRKANRGVFVQEFVFNIQLGKNIIHPGQHQIIHCHHRGALPNAKEQFTSKHTL